MSSVLDGRRKQEGHIVARVQLLDEWTEVYALRPDKMAQVANVDNDDDIGAVRQKTTKPPRGNENAWTVVN